ncbi:MAG: type II secretion system GspH family protein [Candidatus Obscuribacterales bacterium]|nr:type II secretion system GspH family protein [Candidatus Obscuribacterales bacterium]
MHLNRKNKGFTLVELLVVVVIIGILAAIALPNFIGAQTKAKNASVKGNMRTVQIAAESYATDSGGQYGIAVTDIVNFAPGGSNTIAGGTAGTWPGNPLDTASPGVAAGAALADPAAVAALRAGGINAGAIMGQALYAGTADKASYAVTGIGADKKQLADASGLQPLVLSNQ